MDVVVCVECGAPTALVGSTLVAATGTTSRTWRECPACGWESPYEDVVHRLVAAQCRSAEAPVVVDDADRPA